LRLNVAQIRSAAVRRGIASIGTPIAQAAIIGATLDAQHFVWGVPTTTGGYCVGVGGPHRAIGGASCSGAAAGMWGAEYDCDGSVIIGGRIGGLARPTARTLELRHDGRTLRVPIDPSRHGFFIARLPATFFRDVTLHGRRTWPRAAVLDAHGRIVPPVRVNSGPAAPPSRPLCTS
jgi:hypothetical protein